MIRNGDRRGLFDDIRSAVPKCIEDILNTLWAIPCKMKLEVNSQISKHKSKPVSIGSYTSKVSENSRFYTSALGFHFFLRHRMRDFALEKQIVIHITKK